MVSMTSVELVGRPTGPNKFIKAFGFDVPTFIEEAEKALNYHVPLDKRGDFRPTDLAHYNAQKSYRTDNYGRMLCYGQTKADEPCKRRARNFSPWCESHGGALHPLDKPVKDTETALNSEQIQSLSRYRQFQAGYITIDDLDDDELANCGFKSSGGVIFRPKHIPRQLAEEFQRAVFQRAEHEMRALDIEAVHTVGEIMKNRTNEPDIRLKAALSLIERNHGKPTQNVSMTVEQKPFEQVFDSILSVRSERVGELEAAIDAEVVSGDEPNVDLSDGKSDKGFGDSVGSDGSQRGNERAEGEDSIDAGFIEQPIGDDGSDESPGNTRLFARNQAILAQTLEQPFQYDLHDNSKEIKKATQKRFASRVLGVDLTKQAIPMVRHIKKTDRGTLMIRHTEPVMPKMGKDSSAKRKLFTLADFGG